MKIDEIRARPKQQPARNPAFEGCNGFAWVPPSTHFQAFLDKKNKLVVSSVAPRCTSGEGRTDAFKSDL